MAGCSAACWRCRARTGWNAVPRLTRAQGVNTPELQAFSENVPLQDSARARPAVRRPPLAATGSVGEVRHTFTHFHLRLEVRRLALSRRGGDGFVGADEAVAAMPTVFAKAVRLARQ